MLITWHSPPGSEQVQTILLLYNGLCFDIGVNQLVSLLQGFTLKFQSCLPNWVATSSKAFTAHTSRSSLSLLLSNNIFLGMWEERRKGREAISVPSFWGRSCDLTLIAPVEMIIRNIILSEPNRFSRFSPTLAIFCFA